MELFPQLLITHVGIAHISLMLLLCRGVLSARKNDWRQYKILRIAPHLVDTLLLVSGATLLGLLLANDIYTLGEMQWLLPKMVFMVLYIIFAAKAFKKNQPFSLKHFILAVVSFMLTMIVAIIK